MKNFSTAALFLAFSSVVLPISTYAQTPANAVASKTNCAFLQNAPDQHVVVRGDTLWGISGKFLQKPWCWPQVWDLNREQIRNPHWIYPGQVIYFDRAAGKLRLGRGTGTDNGGLATVRLSPQVRSSEAVSDAIATVTLSEIMPFLTKPLIIEHDGLIHAPRIVAVQEGHVNLGIGDKAYVRGELNGRKEFDVFRSGKPLSDPATKKIIGYESVYLGSMELTRLSRAENEPHTFVVTTVKEEMGVSDRLVAIEPKPFMNHVPHAPLEEVDAQIVAVYGGVSQAGQNQIVSINRGSRDGLDIGAVLQLQRLGVIITDRTTGDSRELMKLPDETYGTLLVFRVFENISYGLVMQVTDTVQIADIARSPE